MDGWMDGWMDEHTVKISHNKVMVFGEAVPALPRSVAHRAY